MSDVSFYTSVAEPSLFACRLLRKVQAQGLTVTVCGPARRLDLLDQTLWTFDATSFVAHFRAKANADFDDPAPIWLVETLEQDARARRPNVLLNLGQTVIQGFESYQRVLEIIPTDEVSTRNARERFRVYKTAGHKVEHHEVGA